MPKSSKVSVRTPRKSTSTIRLKIDGELCKLSFDEDGIAEVPEDIVESVVDRVPALELVEEVSKEPEQEDED